MGFWFFMLASNCLLPIILLIFGFTLGKHPPAKINSFVGYRTPRSMQNQDTWQFAHRHNGRIWRRMGAVLLPVSDLLLLPFWYAAEETIALVGLCITFAQLAAIIWSVFATERALRNTFTTSGERKHNSLTTKGI